MEGEGEGMVAIVQGLRDAGLAVTLMRDRRHARKRPTVIGLKQMGQLTHAKSSVETSTNGLPIVPSVDTSAQICDGRYMSSYQFAHCRAKPSSPPVEVAEFPPQRAEPCRTLGNFEIGGVGSGEAHPVLHSSHSPHSFRDNFTLVDRGLLSNSKTSRCSEAFVNSLRRYPSLSPNRSISTDLVQRLLAYTQAKNFTKSSYHSRSLRSLRTKNSDSPKNPSSKTKLTKSVQTYTRGKRGKENAPPTSEREGGTFDDKDRNVRNPKKCRSRSPPNEVRSLRHSDSLIEATYDYLKCSSRRLTHAADVRYLTDVTRCLRDTLRQICYDRPQVCPNIQNRYSKHRREHHRRGVGVESSSNNTNEEAQASLPMVSTGVPVMSSCEAIPGTYLETFPARPKLCCYCRKPTPCICKNAEASRQRFSSSVKIDEFPTKLEDAVMNWFNEIPVYANDNSRDKATREEMARNLINKLIAIRGDDDFEEKANSAIAECINNMPMWCPGNKDDRTMFKKQIAENLVGQVVPLAGKKRSSLGSVDLEDEFQKQIWKWLQDIPEFSNASAGSLSENPNLVESLAKELQKIQANGIDNPNTKEEMQNTVNQWLEDNCKRGRLDSKTKNKLIDQLLGKLIETSKQARKRKSSKLDEDQENMIQEILEWLKDTPELSESKVENHKMAEELAEKFVQLRAQGKDDVELEDEMLNFLTDSFESKGKGLDVRNQSNLISKLIARINGLPNVKEEESLVPEILNCLENIPELDLNSKENKKFAEQLAKKIKEFQSQKPVEANLEEMENEIINMLTGLASDTGAKLSPKSKDQIINKLMNIVTAVPKQRRRWSKQGDPQKVTNSLKEEVGLILDKSKVNFDNRDNIESTLTDILADQVMRGEDEMQTKNRLINALEGSDISHDKSEDIANKLIAMGNEMSIIYKTQDSTIFSDGKTYEISPIQKQMFQESAQREILDFIDEITGDSSAASKKKIKVAARLLAEKVREILTDPDTTSVDKRENIEKEISKCLEGLSIQTDVPLEEQASQLADKLQTLAFKTSTPKRSLLEKDISFWPRRESRSATMSAIDTTQMRSQVPSKEEQQYMGQIVGIIDDWLSKLPVDLESEGKGFKDVMIKDLAGDIIDRQKYLQLNPDATTSEEEELEHLKYQVFRWLHKVPDVKNLMPSIAKTDDLMNRLNAVRVPQLIKPSGKSSMTKDSFVQHLANDLASLQNEIQKWVDAVPPKYLSSKDKSQQREMVKDLAEQIDQYQKEDSFNESVFQELVSEWLEKVLKGADEKYLSSLTEGLKAVLVNKDLMSLSSSLNTGNRKLSISADGVKNAILKWSQNLHFQPGKSIENAKAIIDEFAAIAKALVNVTPENLANIQNNIEKEIKSFLSKLPLHTSKIKDEHIEELRSLLNEIINNASKKLKSMTTDSISLKSGFRKAADVLYDNIVDWCENLPIEGGTPEEREKVKTLKHNIARKLFNTVADLNMKPEIFNDDSLYEDILNDEIDNLLSNLPPSRELEKNFPALKQNLIAQVKEAKLKTQDELAGQAYKQQLRDAISNTLPSVDSLTSEDQAPFEVLKGSLADAYIELHHAAHSEDAKAKLKNKIGEEINKFCDDYLKRYPSSPVDSARLNRELFSVLQKVPVPKDETIKSQVEQVRIKDKINEWLKELPLKEELTPLEQLQTNKIVTYLAKRLHDIEREKEFDPDIDVEDRMQKEIKKWIKKLPIELGQEDKVEEMVEQLTSKLNSSKDSRKLNISKITHSVDFTENTEQDRVSDSICPFSLKTDRPKPPMPSCRKYLSQYAPPFPASTLSTEDRAHLQKIRDRNQTKESSCKAISPCCCKDASVSPIPIDAGSQTDIGQSTSAKMMQPYPPPNQRQIPCSGMSPPECSSCSQSNQPASPHIIVREYYWDTSPESNIESSGVPCSSPEDPVYPQTQQSFPPQYQNSWPQSQPEMQSRRFLNPDEDTGPGFQQSREPLPCMTPQQIPQRQPYMPQPSPSCTQPPPSYLQQQIPKQPTPACQKPPSPCLPPKPPYIEETPSMSPSPCVQPPARKPQQPSMQSQFTPCISPTTTQCPHPAQAPQEPSLQSCMSQGQYAQRSMTSRESPCQMPYPRPFTQKQPFMPEPRPFIPESRTDIPDPPCMPQSPPCMSSRQSIQRPISRTPYMNDASSYTIPKPCTHPQPRERRRDSRHGFPSPDISSASSPFDTECPEANTTHFGPRVTRLGSLDDVPCSKNCGIQSPRAKRSRCSPNEDFDWATRFPEDTDFWGTPCPRRRVHRSPQRDGPFIKEKERKEEKIRCRCRERVMTKCTGRRPGCCDDSMKHCPKCCGVHCPHPSYLFFR